MLYREGKKDLRERLKTLETFKNALATMRISHKCSCNFVNYREWYDVIVEAEDIRVELSMPNEITNPSENGTCKIWCGTMCRQVNSLEDILGALSQKAFVQVIKHLEEMEKVAVERDYTDDNFLNELENILNIFYVCPQFQFAKKEISGVTALIMGRKRNDYSDKDVIIALKEFIKKVREASFFDKI